MNVLVGRVVWVALTVAGFAQMAVTAITREPVREYVFLRGTVTDEFVPGAVLSLMLLTAAWLALGLLAAIADGKWGWGLALVVLVAWLIGGPSLLLWAPSEWLRQVPWSLLGLAGIVAVYATTMSFFLTAVVLGATSLAWLADRIPFLRRHGVADALRATGSRRPVGPQR